MNLIQNIDTSAGPVEFIDTKSAIYSSWAQPRDIKIVTGPDSKGIREEIAVEIRRGQGHPDVGIAQNLKWS